jgi:hypothetical protein
MIIFLNFIIQWTLELRTVWCANNLKLEQKFEENPVLKLEQKLESRTQNHVVAFSVLCAWLHAIAHAVALSIRSIIAWVVQWASRKFSLLFERFIHLFGLFLYYL